MECLLEDEHMILDAKSAMEDELTELDVWIALNIDNFNELIHIHTKEGYTFDIFDPKPYKSCIEEGEDVSKRSY